MLIRFFIQNFLSFDDQVEFSMIASGQERIHSHHILKSKKDHGLVRASLCYGANASGKSNLTKAFASAQDLITQGTAKDQSIPRRPFKLRETSIKEPTIFEFEFRRDGINYNYGFKYNENNILKEWLYEFTKNTERPLFTRSMPQNEGLKNTSPSNRVEHHFEFGTFFNRLPNKEKAFLEFVSKGTRPNQLFLTESIDRNVMQFKPVYDWFNKSLVVIQPSTRAHGLEYRITNDNKLEEFMNSLLSASDTGISDISTEESALEKVDLPLDIKEHISKVIQEKNQKIFIESPFGERYSAGKAKNGEIRVRRLKTKHKLINSNKSVGFDIWEESDGTQRVIDLAPAFNELINGSEEKVYVVDEIGRSLHPHLTRLLFDIHLDEANQKRSSQLIATTHDTQLLDLQLFRRDEIWFMEKNLNHNSDLYSLSEYNPRYDKDIQKDYLLGRYRAVPKLEKTSVLS